MTMCKSWRRMVGEEKWRWKGKKIFKYLEKEKYLVSGGEEHKRKRNIMGKETLLRDGTDGRKSEVLLEVLVDINKCS